MTLLNRHLKKSIMVKISGAQVAKRVTLNEVDEHGIWFVGKDMVDVLAKGVSSDVRLPIVFVPFGQIEWLIAPQEELASTSPAGHDNS